MDVLEQFLYNIAYKFPKGYPDVKDPKDIELLHKLLNEFDPIKTEYENMLNNGWRRVWDSGNLKWVYNI